MNVEKRLALYREGGMVRRCHTTPIIGHYDVAQHSFNMLLLAYELMGAPSHALIRAIVYHDLPERLVGDIPPTACIREQKRAAERVAAETMAITMPELSLIERDWLTALDRLEFWLFCHDQIGFGNRNFIDKAARVGRIIRGDVGTPGDVLSYMRHFNWKRTPEDGVTW